MFKILLLLRKSSPPAARPRPGAGPQLVIARVTTPADPAPAPRQLGGGGHTGHLLLTSPVVLIFCNIVSHIVIMGMGYG